MDKESMIIAYSRLLHLIKNDEIFNDTFYVDALVEHLMIVAKLGFEHAPITDIIFEVIDKRIPPEIFIKNIERFIGLVVISDYSSNGKCNSTYLHLSNRY
jgi:hypothetical protein